MPTSRTRRPAAQGFTLFEVLIVVVVLAAVYALVVPAVAPRLAGSPDEAGRRLASALRQAQATALAAGGETVVTFDAAQGLWTATERTERLSRGIRIARVEVPPIGRLADGRTAVRFFADGSSTGGRIELADGRQSTVVAVDWLTGRVRGPSR
jgi:general secretion pathway protein H